MNFLKRYKLTIRLFPLLVLFIGIVSPDTYGTTNSSGITILVPTTGEKAYEIAGQTFADMWEKVTGEKPAVYYMKPDQRELPEGEVILIGSDAVNPVVHELIREGTLESLNIQYGGDNYRILSLSKNGNNYLILAGGSGRSTIYAVYDFFRKQAGAEYFWDGDIIPARQQIQLSGIDVLEKPHFEYRGLRYFAHRGLHRFQAEHWDLEDWKKEIDWLMKKRFNLFMLRTGTDDLFQRAFPEDVPYPPVDVQDPDSKQRSYNDRTSFWPLRYRGELRRQVLQYARERGLIHPEDVGTITHWYSPTPSSFFKNKPDFPLMETGKTNYMFPMHAVFDIESPMAWDTYWKLSQTHISEFGGGSPRMFHTIGLAERKIGNERENLQNKLFVYRKTQQTVREHYPDAPLLIASWDFLDRWKDKDVQMLLEEFDPQRTIVLDYVADNISKVSYSDWGLKNNFPWIFGIIHSFANNSDIHGNYEDIIAPRLKEAQKDSMCVGLVVWSEISHSDTYLLEYLADNSWQPDRPETEEATKRYCTSRYPSEIQQEMIGLWKSFLALSQSNNWGKTGGTVREPQFRLLSSTELINLTPDRLKKLEADLQHLHAGLKQSVSVLNGLTTIADENYENPFWLRDAIDMSRTIASNALYASLAKGAIQMEAWRVQEAGSKDIRRLSELSRKLLSSLNNILAMSDDFSMYASLQQLREANQLEGISPMLNPHTEQALKGNAENNYCRSHHYELAEYVYLAELDAYWNWVFKRIKSGERSEWKYPEVFAEQKKIIEDQFYATPLLKMAPTRSHHNAKSFADTLNYLEGLITGLLKEI
ncbi:hypothetical protein D1164_09775 [Mariniphaga sediminis]|uniref:Alpha-N-acetylglucosaminidase tim-barrel domain-containing protein n=1 Tax=Mariniphaga sediminis TaxID=1628158 RepID=A0A399D069_9BACT|nr:alpha-N-acetylglucosaminidase TIM-barrel domain-containing protein [Mariniphaga sediminis]RIH65405.1 hypothetical protein D1164_09775 [Mariniphaga sediminis]